MRSKIVRGFCVAGIVIPLVQMIAGGFARRCCGYIAGPEFLILWPTSIFLMGAEGQPWWMGILVASVAILMNVPIYYVAGSAVELVLRRFSSRSGGST
jgi:hypothetical protein